MKDGTCSSFRQNKIFLFSISINPTSVAMANIHKMGWRQDKQLGLE